jgi:immune inhibitor A
MMRSRCQLVVVLLPVVVIAACTAPPTLPLSPTAPLIPSSTPTSTPPPTSTPTPIPTLTATPMLPPSPTPDDSGNDPHKSSFEPPPRPFDYVVVNPEPPQRVPNATRTFWVYDGETGERREITARLRVQTEHAAMWVEEGIWHDVRQLEAAATWFETQIYSTTRAVFGSEWTPGVDNDPHIHILHAADLGEGVVGYTSSADEFPRALYPHSNEAETIMVHIGPVEVGSPAYYALLARQFQRIIQWFQDRNEERWVKEGGAELAVRLNGLDSDEPERAYLERPDTSLTAWQSEDAVAHRGAAYLFLSYFHEWYGDEGTRLLTSQSLNGATGFDAALVELGADLTFEDMFAQWLVANYLGVQPPAPAAICESTPVTVESSVQQFGADYILLRGQDDIRIRFVGTTTTPLLGVSPHSGSSSWWSNRADESLTTLTRAFDLSIISDTEPITLTYWTWYDIEPDYDYVSVQVSTDGGEQWRILSTHSGTSDDPHGSNPGWGYTGQSSDPPGWIQEAVDLSPYSGGEVLVRFAYWTDEAVAQVGFVLDDIAIPRIGYADDVESGESGWESAGFVRADDLVSQRYLALLIGLGEGPEGEITVERLAVGEQGLAEWEVPLDSEGWREAVIVLSGMAPLTTHPALYQLTVEK